MSVAPEFCDELEKQYCVTGILCTIDGLTIAGEPKGDWVVTLKRVNAP